MLVHLRVTPSIKFAGTPFIHLGGEKHCESKVALSVLLKNTTQCARPGLEPQTLDLELSALTDHGAEYLNNTYCLES